MRFNSNSMEIPNSCYMMPFMDMYEANEYQAWLYDTIIPVNHPWLTRQLESMGISQNDDDYEVVERSVWEKRG